MDELRTAAMTIKKSSVPNHLLMHNRVYRRKTNATRTIPMKMPLTIARAGPRVTGLV